MPSMSSAAASASRRRAAAGPGEPAQRPPLLGPALPGEGGGLDAGQLIGRLQRLDRRDVRRPLGYRHDELRPESDAEARRDLRRREEARAGVEKGTGSPAGVISRSTTSAKRRL